MPGSQILLFAVREMPAHSRDQSQDGAERCQQDRQRIPQISRKRSPEQAADGSSAQIDN
jgi:hypothetical protein